MIPDREGIYNGIRGLDLVAQVIVEAVGINAFSGHSALEASQAAAPEGIFPDINHPGLSVHLRPKTGDHIFQLYIPLNKIRDDDNIPIG
jgi:hypothetical protein